MRLHATILLGLLVASPAAAQSDRNAEPPAGQTLLNGLIGKDQTSTSRENDSIFKGDAPEETKEQSEHYKKRSPSEQPATSGSQPGQGVR